MTLLPTPCLSILSVFLVSIFSSFVVASLGLTTVSLPDPDWPSVPPGLSISNLTCSTIQTLQILRALRLIQALSAGGLKAAEAESSPIFGFFFHEADKPLVQNAFRNITTIATGRGPSVVISCFDLMRTCNRDTMSYLGIARPRIQASHQPLILCSEFFNLPTMIDPCDRSSLEAAIVTKHRRGGQFGACQALSILHELLHVNHIVGPEISHLRDVLPFAALAHEHRISRFPDIKKLTEQIYKRWQPRENVNAYQLMAAWAWMSPRQKAKCPQNYRLWGILDAGSMEEVDAILPNVPLDPERDTGELRRKLLGVFWRRGPSGGA